MTRPGDITELSNFANTEQAPVIARETRVKLSGTMNLPFGLQLKDVIGPIVAIIAAALSWFWYWRNIRLAQRNANRSIYVDGQKFLIDVCKQLISEPILWCVYDDEPLRNEKIYDINDPVQQAKLRAFAHLHLNMFEIIVNEVPKPAVLGKRTASNVWYDYLGDTLSRSRMVREILDEPASKEIWSDALHREYRRWRESAIGRRIACQQTGAATERPSKQAQE